MMDAGQIALSRATVEACGLIDRLVAAGDMAGAVRAAATAPTGGYWPGEHVQQREAFAAYAAKAIARATP